MTFTTGRGPPYLEKIVHQDVLRLDLSDALGENQVKDSVSLPRAIQTAVLKL
ncbi:hypothetical protein [Infirmifilum sp.]|uniref:hypothetical protein n=1 Tax=Infirmifilum sp. TaxID=2856575 RepID=UPI003D127C9D